MPRTYLPHSLTPGDTRDVSALDPLRADATLRQVPTLNAAADVPALATTLRELVSRVPTPQDLTLAERLAVMRDLGLLLGSIKRHGTSPMEAVPEAEPVLLALGRSTDMIPRDTVHHYTEWNPTDERQRMYTGDPQEGFLMNGARMSLPHLANAVTLCAQLAETEPDQAEFADLLLRTAEAVSAFDRAISMVVEKVSPDFFAQQMRPYYEEISVAGQEYLGPAAAHVPLFLVDLLTWASDHGDPVYDAFIEEATQHTLPQWRVRAGAWQSAPSLVSKVSAAVTDNPGPTVWESAKALAAVLRTLMMFRGKHLAIARKAYREEVRLYELGSGRGSVALLHQILDLTRENATLVRHAPGRGAATRPEADSHV